MDLRTFIETTLADIVQGVAAARTNTLAVAVAENPQFSETAPFFGVAPSAMGGEKTPISSVEFDVALKIEESRSHVLDGKVTVAVVSGGGERQEEHSSSHDLRIKFSVPVRFA